MSPSIEPARGKGSYNGKDNGNYSLAPPRPPNGKGKDHGMDQDDDRGRVMLVIDAVRTLHYLLEKKLAGRVLGTAANTTKVRIRVGVGDIHSTEMNRIGPVRMASPLGG